MKPRDTYLSKVLIPFCLGPPTSAPAIPPGWKRPEAGLDAPPPSADCWNTSMVALAMLSSRLFISATEPEP